MLSFRRNYQSWPPHRNVTLVFVSLASFGCRGSVRFRHGAFPVQTRMPHGCWTRIAKAIGHYSADAVKQQFLRTWTGMTMIQKLANSACSWSHLSSLPDLGPSCVESLRRRAADAKHAKHTLRYGISTVPFSLLHTPPPIASVSLLLRWRPSPQFLSAFTFPVSSFSMPIL